MEQLQLFGLIYLAMLLLFHIGYNVTFKTKLYATLVYSLCIYSVLSLTYEISELLADYIIK
jgi:hypothetical protein